MGSTGKHRQPYAEHSSFGFSKFLDEWVGAVRRSSLRVRRGTSLALSCKIFHTAVLNVSTF